jgi:O-antigen/teichoic acid export membrane protein
MRPKRILAGVGWNTVGQFLIIGISLGLTPFLLHRLGATQYGIFVFASTARGLISNLDGGLGPTTSRYFPVYVGRGNVAATTSLLLTMLTLLAIVVGAETVTIFTFAPSAWRLFALGSGSAGHSHEIVQLIRELTPALFISAIRTPFQQLVTAHHRWAFINYITIIATVASTAITVAVAVKTSSLQCLVWGSYTQEVILIIAMVWACRRYVSLKHLDWLPTSEVRQIFRFGSRVQIAAVASSLNSELNTLLMGFFFPTQYVAYYGIGANFSQQVSNMTYNGLNPIALDIGHKYGRHGTKGVLQKFPDIQRNWVTILGIFPMAAALVGWFGIHAWLGVGSEFASATATVLVIGAILPIFNSIVDLTAKAVGMPEIESWYLGIGVVVNLVFTLLLALSIGAIGIPTGTAIGQVVSFVVCIWLARRKMGKEIKPFFLYIRYFPALVAIAVAGACEWEFSNSLPTGGIGFVLSGVLTLPGFITYYGWVYREPLVQKFKDRTRHEESGRTTDIQEDDIAYTRRQLSGLQALMALAEPDTTGRQLRGLEALMALAEPDMSILPFAGSPTRLRYTGGQARLRYTSPLELAHEGPLEPPFQARKTASGRYRELATRCPPSRLDRRASCGRRGTAGQVRAQRAHRGLPTPHHLRPGMSRCSGGSCKRLGPAQAPGARTLAVQPPRLSPA